MPETRLPGAISLPDGVWVRGRGLRRPARAGVAPDYGLYLGGGRLRRAHDQGITWTHEWIDWPDFLLPRDREQAIGRIRALHEQARAGRRVEVACGGGVGRTGTVIALCAIDNLGKGASGAAIQCANLAAGLPETTGLQLVGTYP